MPSTIWDNVDDDLPPSHEFVPFTGQVRVECPLCGRQAELEQQDGQYEDEWHGMCPLGHKFQLVYWNDRLWEMEEI